MFEEGGGEPRGSWNSGFDLEQPVGGYFRVHGNQEEKSVKKLR